jgi:hypothetical protein
VSKPKPGIGWTNVWGPVWDHASGARLHLGGFLRLPSGEHISANRWPELLSLNRYIRIAGGSRKRGLMLWALSKLIPPNPPASEGAERE